jgi:hypothetical protein
MISKSGLALIGALLVLGPVAPGIAVAQQAPAAEPAAPAPRAARRRTPPKNAAEVVFVNGRQGVLVEAAVTNAAGKAVARLKRPLEPGKRAAFKLPAKAGCVFAVSAAFSDEANFDQGEVNLCADKVVRFVD